MALMMTCFCYDVNPDNLFDQFGLTNLQTQQVIAKAVMVYKSLHGLTPEYLISKFVYRNLPYSIRDSTNKLHLLLLRTNYLKNSFRYSGLALWNRLPLT